MTSRSYALLAFLAGLVLGVAAVVCNSFAWGPSCTPELAGAHSVARVLAIAAGLTLLAVPLLCLGIVIAALVQRRDDDGFWARLNATLFVVWWPVAVYAWLILGQIADSGCDPS